ncbi:hypothetical protein HKCCE3408_01965 [Rhodobacterales bacterium HKCCE3408]|nr:hypothetical protein [Rhodobacterales bacterium HKCCE3408]
MRFLLAISMALAALPARADVDLIEVTRLQTRFGEVQVIGGDIDQQLWYDGQFLPLNVAQLYWIRGAWGLADEAQDWVLVSSNHMGNMCGGFENYFLIRAQAGSAQVSPPIDACVGVLDLRVYPGRVEIDMGHADLTIARETISWDGTSMTRTLVPAATQPVPGPGADVTRWIGSGSAQIFQDAGERARFGTVMPPEAVQQLYEVVSLGGSVMQRDGWIMAAGCRPHMCGEVHGAWAIRIADGAVAAALARPGRTWQTYGQAGDPVFVRWLAENTN